MKSNLFLPDTSAILTMMDNEEGADIVENILRTKKIIFPAMVLFEVYYKTIQYQGLEAAQLRYATLKSIKANHISELTEPVLLKGGEIKAVHQISIADSIIVAHAIIYNATLIHKDPEFEIITIVDQIKLPFIHRLEKK